MKKTAILIDSTFYMSKADIKNNNFYVIPLNVNFEEVSFMENSLDNKQIDEVFKKIEKLKKLPHTSQPNTDIAINLFDKIKKDGYEKVICLHISSKLSGTVQGMKVAANYYMEEFGGLEIEIYDTLATAQIGAEIAKTIATIIRQKNEITSEQINDVISFISTNTKSFIFVDKLYYLAYGGRIPVSFASVGNLFGITPIITLSSTGELERFKAERSQKKAVATIIKLLKDEDFKKDDKLILNSFYTTDSKVSKKLLKECNKSTNANIIASDCTQMGIVVSNHLGPNAYGCLLQVKFDPFMQIIAIEN